MSRVDEFDYDRARADERVWRLARAGGFSRRRFLELAGLAAAGVVAGCRGESGDPRAVPAPSTTAAPTPTTASAVNPGGWVKPVPEDKFIIHKTNAEMRWEQMAKHDYVTPNHQFFIRNHTTTARLDRGRWRLRVEGSGVERPLDLTYDDLVKVGAETRVTRFVECAGNARGFYGEALGMKAEGTQWRLGAVGVAEWTGVPLGAVLERAGVKRAARDVMPVGLDDLMVRRPMPLAKANADDTLLVYAMNGDDLPADHGAPVRALVPGWIGVANVKWVGKVEVSEEPLYSDWNTASYVFVGPGYEPEGMARGPALSAQPVKSAFELAWPATVGGGPQALRGRSWSGKGRVAKVEVSVDGGPWQAATTEGPNEPGAWVRWAFPWDAPAGEHLVRARATDDQGNTQPEKGRFNEQGYAYDAVVAHPVTVA